MPPRKRRKKITKFLKRDKLSMIEELRKEKGSNVIEKCVTVVRERVHLKVCRETAGTAFFGDALTGVVIVELEAAVVSSGSLTVF